jgi:hypothetical protein
MWKILMRQFIIENAEIAIEALPTLISSKYG